ncbi:methyltransferase [Zoogloea sp.]|uniref:methyltransferase n=1 Tax=Zoogloea sp. TaxID=49181 RepID=UPI0014163AD5|nr:MAG: methyltransferase [Zoogloea sp.]
MTLRERFLDLQDCLQTHQDLWQASPFYLRRPAWCVQWPGLAEAALELDDTTLATLADNPEALYAWLALHFPDAERLAALCQLPALPARQLAPTSPHFDWEIPLRKRLQIEAFASHAPASPAPLLEWCAGKGHLGRRVAVSDQQPVSSLEIDAALCEDALRLARRARIEQTVVCADALAAGSRPLLKGRSVLALHACGELHRTLVRNAAEDEAHAYRLAPCCYYRGAQDGYRPLNRDADLPLDGNTLRLAVTETVTAPQRIRERHARDQAWKLGFVALRNAILGEAIRPFKPVPGSWLSGDFADYCRRLAEREGLALDGGLDAARWLAVGEQRRGEVRRLELVRHAFRRPLEIWLALDVALGLEEAGFQARLGTFCERSLTPRNLMVVAER